MNDGKIYMTDETGREICLDYVHNVTITTAEPEGEGMPRSFSRTFETSFETFKTAIERLFSAFLLKVVTDTVNNNARRRHHMPMLRRRKGVYIYDVSSGEWKKEPVSLNGHKMKAYTHYGRRGQNDTNRASGQSGVY